MADLALYTARAASEGLKNLAREKEEKGLK